MHTRKLTESKESKIKKLNLTDEQKEILINLFNKYNYLESKIDWNNPNLTWEDFKEVIAAAGKSKSSRKNHGIEGLVKGKDYVDLGEGYNDEIGSYRLYQPLTYEGSKVLASNKVPPVKENGAKWCISYQKTSKYWDDYSERRIAFLFVFTEDTKYAVTSYLDSPGFEGGIEVYSFDDKNLGYLDWCKQDRRIVRALSSLKRLKIWGFRDCIISNEDGTLDFDPERIKSREEGVRISQSISARNSYETRVFLEEHIVNGKFNVKFGKWNGDFFCDNMGLNSLEGCPSEVSGEFNCTGNPLTSLKGGPRKAKTYKCGGFAGELYLSYAERPGLESLEGAPEECISFSCERSKIKNLEGLSSLKAHFLNIEDNPFLISLKGAPREVGHFNCTSSPLLRSLERGPSIITGSYTCKYCKLMSLKGAPEEANGLFDCSNNELTSLEGAPKKMISPGTFICSYNNLKSLKGLPSGVEELRCNGNKLESLEGCPPKMKSLLVSLNKLRTLKGAPTVVGRFEIDNNLLETLEGCPQKVNILHCSGNKLKSLKGVAPYIKGSFNCYSNHDLNSLEGLVNVGSIYWGWNAPGTKLGNTLKTVRGMIHTNDQLLVLQAQAAHFATTSQL